ncbi:MAG: ankyrin repeat domain-containing protein, partial [Bacteroidota bacterium]|nr:ankyrin repeat domain-containing protein [Bacteroidota bacterium]
MDRNKNLLLFLTFFMFLSASLKAQDLSTKQLYDPNLKFALPADCKVKMNWIIAPIEDSVVKKGSIYALSFGVDLYKQPWIGFHNEDILNLAKQYQFKISPRYESFTVLENGAFLVANENDLGYVVAPNSKSKDYNNRITAQFQPIAELPIRGCKIYPGAGNCLFLSAQNVASELYEIYLLSPEKSSNGSTLKEYKKVYSSQKSITGIAGDSATIYIASYQLLLKLDVKSGAITKIPLNTSNSGINGLAYNEQSGLFYSTENGVGYVGANTNIPFLSCRAPMIYLRGGTLYVLNSKTMGVLSFDNIGDLKRFDKPIEDVAPTTTTDVKPVMVRFFEGPSPAQPLNERKYALTFGKDTTRFIYGEITLQNLLYQKQPNKQIIEMVLTRPFSTNWESQKVLFDFGLNYASLVGWFQFGSGVLGSNYPGEYIMTTYLNNIKLDSRSFRVTGNVTIVEAAENNDSLKLRELIRNGADVNFKNQYGTSALIQVAIMGDLESSKMLIDRGADVNARNSPGQSPLITACMRYSDNAPIVKL